MSNLDRRLHELRRKYPVRMYAKDIAREEQCSAEWAARMISKGEFGEVTKRNSRVLYIYTEGFIEYLRTKTVIYKASA